MQSNAALQPADQIILPGQQLAVIIFSGDSCSALPPPPGSVRKVDLDAAFTMPSVGGQARLHAAVRATCARRSPLDAYSPTTPMPMERLADGSTKASTSRTVRRTASALALALAASVSASPAEAQGWRPDSSHLQLPIWPRGVPDSQPARAPESAITPSANVVAGRRWTSVRNVSVPTITLYTPTAKLNTHAAVLVFPGGGYQILAIDLEGTEVCDWLVSRGITCVLLKYRVPNSGPHWDAKCRCHTTPRPLTALQDAQRAIGLVRAHAAEWQVDPHKVGVIGFSAGGHLVAAISNDWRKRIYERVDAADDQSARPDFAIGVYPGHLWASDTAHSAIAFNPDIHVSRQTPPTFLVQAETDSIDNVNQSLAYYVALKNAGVPVEMHLYVNGGHAFGLRRTRDPITEWPLLVERWLRTIRVIDAVDSPRSTTDTSLPAARGSDTTRVHGVLGCQGFAFPALSPGCRSTLE